jgi:hypothetical protein
MGGVTVDIFDLSSDSRFRRLVIGWSVVDVFVIGVHFASRVFVVVVGLCQSAVAVWTVWWGGVFLFWGVEV